jgi:phosphohistidine phosphatase SixA
MRTHPRGPSLQSHTLSIISERFTTLRYLLLALACALALALTLTNTSFAAEKRFDGKVIFIRHALAPGNGDPTNFNLKDCRTQRNLDETGRQQARAIGKRLAASGLEFAAIYSSEWCRCLETAQLLGLGPVTPFNGLNSFFEDHVPREPTLAKLAEKLADLPVDGKPIIMVTHFVTISAVSNIAVSSGGMIMLDLETGIARQIALAAFDPPEEN